MADVCDVANYFLYLDQENEEGNEEGISNLKLQKLVYYAQGFNLAIFGEPLFNAPIQAWAHGPVVPDLYHKYKDYGKQPLNIDDDFNGMDLASEERGLIEEIYEVFGQFSAWKLRNMTHEEAPWVDHEREAGTIPHTELEEYFKTRIN